MVNADLKQRPTGRILLLPGQKVQYPNRGVIDEPTRKRMDKGAQIFVIVGSRHFAASTRLGLIIKFSYPRSLARSVIVRVPPSGSGTPRRWFSQLRIPRSAKAEWPDYLGPRGITAASSLQLNPDVHSYQLKCMIRPRIASKTCRAQTLPIDRRRRTIPHECPPTPEKGER